MEECHRTLGSRPRSGVDELDALGCEARQFGAHVVHLEAQVMESLALRGKEAGDAGRVVGRLHELDLRFPDAEEGDPYPVRRDVHDRLERHAEDVAVQGNALLDGPDHDGHVMDASGRQVRHASP